MVHLQVAFVGRCSKTIQCGITSQAGTKLLMATWKVFLWFWMDLAMKVWRAKLNHIQSKKIKTQYWIWIIRCKWIWMDVIWYDVIFTAKSGQEPSYNLQCPTGMWQHLFPYLSVSLSWEKVLAVSSENVGQGSSYDLYALVLWSNHVYSCYDHCPVICQLSSVRGSSTKLNRSTLSEHTGHSSNGLFSTQERCPPGCPLGQNHLYTVI